MPPLEVQNAIVEEIEQCQKVIDGAKQVISNYRPTISIDPNWEMVKLGDVCSFEYGKALPEKDRVDGEFPVMGSNGITGYHNQYLIKNPAIIIGRKGSSGKVAWIDKNCYPIDTTYYVKLLNNKIDFKFLYFLLLQSNLDSLSGGAGIPGLNRNDAYLVEIPLPSLEEQKAIVAEIEKERLAVEGCKELVEQFETKIKTKIAKIWGEEL